jgi:protein transport protein SEC24
MASTHTGRVPPGPPTFHSGQGRYPSQPQSSPTVAAAGGGGAAAEGASTVKTSGNAKKASVNRPPTSYTKPRTSRRPKPTKDSRIDPRQIPRPNLPSKQTTVDAVYATRTGKGLPPEDCGDYLVEDQGNASPRLLRMTTNSIPRAKDMLIASKIPFRAHVRPFAPLDERDTPIPMLDFGQEGPPRCGRCNGFINPYVKFEDDGKAWRCNLCNVLNEVENPGYICNLDAYGRRYDLDSRHELVHGCVDYIVPDKYRVRPPQEKIFVFAIDVSYSAISTGLTSNAIASIKSSMSYLQRTQTASSHGDVRVGILTYDTSIQFYDLRTFDDTRDEPYVLYVTDVDSPFAAIPPNAWILPLGGSGEGSGMSKICRLLDLLPDMYTPPEEERTLRRRSSGTVRDTWSHGCSTAAVVAAKDSLTTTGGKIVVFQSGIPSRGAGKLRNREDGALYGTKEESTMYHPRHHDKKHLQLQKASKASSSSSKSSSPAAAVGGMTESMLSSLDSLGSSASSNDFYVRLSKQCTEAQVSVDQFICSSGYTDIATLGQLSTATGGRVCYYPGFDNRRTSDCVRMKEDVHHLMTNLRAYEVAMKVRVSDGLSVGGVQGVGLETSSVTQRDVTCLCEDSSFHILLHYDKDLPNESSDAFLQVSFLHTDLYQRRVVRVINFAMPIVTSLSAVFRYADVHCVCNSILREYSEMTRTQLLEDIRKKMAGHCVDILYAYRQHCASNHSSGQVRFNNGIQC